MNGTPRTWFSGKSAPEDRKGPDGTTIAAIIFCVLSPLGALTALGGYLAFTLGRYSWKVIGGATGIYAALFVLFGGFREGFLARYLAPWSEVWAAFGAKTGEGIGAVAADRWPHWLLAQAGLSLLLGGAFATAFTAWKWVRRATWEENDRRPGPIEVWRLRKHVKAIANGTINPRDGHTIGTLPNGELIVQTTAEGSAHTLIAGGSGSGKTTTMLAGIRDDIRQGHGVVFVDLKGATDVPAQLAEWADRYGRRFLHWTIQDPRAPYHGPADAPAFYDPIGRGDPSRRKDLLIGSQKWDVEYYKTVIANYLQIAFTVADLVPNPNADSFTDLADLLDPRKLSLRAGHLLRNAPLTVEAQQQLYGQPADFKWWEYIPHVLDPSLAEVLASVDATVNGMEETERSGIRNMSARMQTLTRSIAGAWLKRDPQGLRDIDLRRVADEGWVVVFTLDSANYEQTAAQIGGLVIQDVKTLSSELRHNPAPHPMHLYIDEFSAIGSDNVLGLLARARDAKIPVTLSTQALADLTKADATFLDQCLGIVNCFMIHRANTEHDAEVLAGLTGKVIRAKRQYGIEMTSGMPGGLAQGAATGTGFIREEEEWTVMPSKIQSLKPGMLVYIANSPERRVPYPVQVTREDPLAVAQAGMDARAPRAEVRRIDPAPLTPSAFDLPNGIDAHAPAPTPSRPTAPPAGVVEGDGGGFAPVPYTPGEASVPRPGGAGPGQGKALSLVPSIEQPPVHEEPEGAALWPEPPPEPGFEPVPEYHHDGWAPGATVPRPTVPLINPDAFRSRDRVPVEAPPAPTLGPDAAEQAAPAYAAPVDADVAPAQPYPADPSPAAVDPQVAPPRSAGAGPASPEPESAAPVPGPGTPETTHPLSRVPAVGHDQDAAPSLGLPKRRPVLTAPWITGEGGDELGRPLVPSMTAAPADDLGEPSAFGATLDANESWGESVPETGPVHLRPSALRDPAPRPGPPVSEIDNLPTTPRADAFRFPDATDAEKDWSNNR